MSIIEENCDNMTNYSESVVTVDSDLEIDETASTITEGSEWGDQFVPWELKVSTLVINLYQTLIRSESDRSKYTLLG